MAIYKIAEVREAMIGQWETALRQLVGMDDRQFNKRHQSCPVCGGKDRWRWTDSKGKDERGHGWSWCNGCGAMDGLKLFQRLYGEPFNVCVNVLGDWANAVPVERREAAKKAVNNAPVYNYGKQETPERCRALLDRCYDEVGTPFTWEEGLPDRAIKVRYRGDVPDLAEDHYICEPLYMVQGEAVDPDPCNVVKIYGAGEFDFFAGDLTFGSVSRINQQDSGPIFLAVDYINGCLAAQATGREVWICWLSSNIDHVARRWARQDRRLNFVTMPDDFHSLCYAEENQLPVFTPRYGQWAMGLNRDPQRASDLLDALQK